MIIIILGQITNYEKELLNDIFSKMNVKMYNISFKILRNKHDAEEAVGQTFLKIMENIEKISALPCPQMEAYCVIILKNESVNIIRKGKKILHMEDADHISHYDGQDHILEAYFDNLDRERLISCVDKLSEDERRLIYFRYVHEMRLKEISGILGITEEAAKKRSQRILEKLRLYYRESEIGGS